MIAYTVACYFGDRRVKDQAYIDNPMDYINHQVIQLTKLKTTLISNIIFVINGEPRAAIIPSQINDIDVRVYYRDNIGMSYGAWDYAYQRTKGEYDSYFLMEDDYIPLIDNFDDAFYSFMKGDIGYVCSFMRDGHGAISNGLVKASALNTIGGVPYAKDVNYGHNEQQGQWKFGRELLKNNIGMTDVTSMYEVPFVNHAGHFLYYGNTEGPRIMSPTILERKSLIHDSII